MSISRRLPQSDEGRERALNAAKLRKDRIGVSSGMVLSPGTVTRLDTMRTQFFNLMRDRDRAERALGASTEASEPAKVKLKMFDSHFIQGLNMGIARDEYAPSDRLFYSLDENSDAVPSLSSEDDLLYWGQQIVSGEADRMLQPIALPMDRPSAAQVQTAMSDFVTKNQLQEDCKLNLKTAQQAINDIRAEVDKLILHIWNELETAYDNLEAPAQRDQCRAWGVVYEGSTTRIIKVLVLDLATSLAIPGASVHLSGNDKVHITEIDGRTSFSTTVESAIDIVTEMPGYVRDEQSLEFKDEVMEYSVVVKLGK